ncbi:MAG: PD40 domain-containing protein, partial [Candidatus Zixiibacteriota bacterium]
DNWDVWGAADTMPEERRPTFVDSLLKFGRTYIKPVWSPDGTKLTYGSVEWSEENGDLCLIRHDGTDAKILSAGGENGVKYTIPYDWSTDGQYILGAAVTRQDSVQLLIISTADGSTNELHTIEASGWNFKGGYFSRDGRSVAYTSVDNDIFLLSVDGTIHQPLIEHSARDYLLGWSPDGRYICFASDRSGTMDAWVIEVREDKPYGEPRKVSRNMGEIVPLGISQEGALYYGLQSVVTDVYVAVIDPQNGTLQATPQKVTQRFEGTNYYPDWSPDGKYLLYRSDREGRDDLGPKSPFCEREMETGKEREFFVQLKSSRAHHYSPDGRSVIVQGVDSNDQNGLFQVDVETGRTTMLVKCSDDTRIRWATWSPDGKKLFYKYMVTSTEPTRLVQYNLESGQEKELFRESSWPTCPALSPDGKWLAFQTLDEEKIIRSLNVMPADSGRLREIVRLQENECIYSVDWMPDGKSILYVKNVSDNHKKREVWQVPVKGGSPRNTGLTMDKITYLSVHPDGPQIAFSSYQEQTEIWVMENFLTDH